MADSAAKIALFFDKLEKEYVKATAALEADNPTDAIVAQAVVIELQVELIDALMRLLGLADVPEGYEDVAISPTSWMNEPQPDIDYEAQKIRHRDPVLKDGTQPAQQHFMEDGKCTVYGCPMQSPEPERTES